MLDATSGEPNEVKRLCGAVALQWVYAPIDDGSRVIVYLAAGTHVVTDVQRLHQRR